MKPQFRSVGIFLIAWIALASASAHAESLVPRRKGAAHAAGSWLVDRASESLEVRMDGYLERGYDIYISGAVIGEGREIPFQSVQRRDDSGDRSFTFEIPLIEDVQEPCSELHLERLDLQVRLAGISRVEIVKGLLTVETADDYCDHPRLRREVSLFPASLLPASGLQPGIFHVLSESRVEKRKPELKQTLVLRPVLGEKFARLESRTLSKTDGSVLLEIEGLDFSGGDYTLRGKWGGVPFSSTYRIDNRAGLMRFSLELVKEAFPCADVHIETADLELAPGADGLLELRSASLQVESTRDDCHIAREWNRVKLERRADQRFDLRPRSLEAFKRIGARTLNPMDGSVSLDLQSLEFDGDHWILKGFWGSVPFMAMNHAQEASGPVWFEFEVFRREAACADGEYEVAELVVSSDDKGAIKLLEAGLRVESTSDSCHLTPQGETISLVF
jgi:hypothetical protein